MLNIGDLVASLELEDTLTGDLTKANDVVEESVRVFGAWTEAQQKAEMAMSGVHDIKSEAKRS